MSRYRGTRPTRPNPWPRRAERYRQDAYDAAGEIVKMVHRVRQCPQEHAPATQCILAEIGEMAQYIQRMMIEARLLGAHQALDYDDLTEQVATLRADLTELRATLTGVPPLRITPHREA